MFKSKEEIMSEDEVIGQDEKDFRQYVYVLGRHFIIFDVC